MKTHNFRINLASGLYATGSIDFDNSNVVSKQTVQDYVDMLSKQSGSITQRTEFYDLIDRLLGDSKFKTILSVYNVKVY